MQIIHLVGPTGSGISEILELARKDATLSKDVSVIDAYAHEDVWQVLSKESARLDKKILLVTGLLHDSKLVAKAKSLLGDDSIVLFFNAIQSVCFHRINYQRPAEVTQEEFRKTFSAQSASLGVLLPTLVRKSAHVYHLDGNQSLSALFADFMAHVRYVLSPPPKPAPAPEQPAPAVHPINEIPAGHYVYPTHTPAATVARL